ncbi:MAG: phosphodiester glycosidase family protein [Pseudomonadota bacterium]
MKPRNSVLAILPVLLLVVPVRATDTWTTPHPGIRHLTRSTSNPWRIHALKIDLCARGVRLQATDESQHRRTTSSFANLVGAEAAINGDFFSYTDYFPTDLAVGNGHVWKPDRSGSLELVFGDDTALVNLSTLSSVPSWVQQAVGGRPILVQDGGVPASFNRSDCSQRHPRTAAGFSRDRQTLFLAVVDGRTSASIGMTCAELGTLMKGLGAWTAINLDGGGSTTMWLRGSGVVNHPSDGSERVVGNHLAVHATGSGNPGSCDWSVDEVVLQAHQQDDARSTDLDGDGQADLCARSSGGLLCYPSTGSGFGARWQLGDLSNASGFDDETNFATLRIGDVDGDGLGDVCARRDAGFSCWRSTGSGFAPRQDGPALSDASGWSKPQYFSTLRLADINGDGRDDLCARAAAGFRCYPSTGSGFGAAISGPALSDANGWNTEDHFGTIRMGDVDGDGKEDVCARSNNRMQCWLSDGVGFPTLINGPAWSDASGWAQVPYWSTIRLADIDNDGKADLCGRGSASFECHLSTGRGFVPATAGPGMADSSGWRDHGNYASLRLGDIDGDGDLDLCARANARVYCWKWLGSSFGERVDGPTLSDASGWNFHTYYSSLRLGDLDGDGKADLCARGSAGVRCYRSTGSGFSAAIMGPALTDEVGWGSLKYYSTLRFAGPRRGCGAVQWPGRRRGWPGRRGDLRGT